MKLAGMKAASAITTKKGGSPIHFLRVLKYSRPYRKYLIPGLVCIAVFAMTYSLNLITLMPIVKLMADDQSLPSWVDQLVTEKRLGFLLANDEGKLSVLRDSHKKALPGGAHNRDRVRAIDGRNRTAEEAYAYIAELPEGALLNLGLLHEPTGEASTIVVTLKSPDTTHRWLRRVAALLPRSTSKSAKMHTLYIVLSAVLVITLVGGVCRFFGEYLIALVAARTIVSMRRKMYHRVLNLPLPQFARLGASDVVSRFVQDSQEVYRGLNFVFAKSLREPLKAMFAFLLALTLNWRITLVTVVVAPLAGIMIRKFGKMIRRAQKGLLQGYGRMLSALDSAVSGIRVVKGYNMESYERRHLHAVDITMLKQQMKIERTDALTGPVFELIGVTLGAVGIVYFAGLMFDNRMDFSRFAALAACMAGMFDPVRKMSSFYNRIQQANAALDRVFEIIDSPVEESGAQATAVLPTLAEKIEFANVSFTYPGAEQPAIRDVSLVIRRGERIAFVGPNGSGKTTLLALLMRFYEPGQGKILFDGRDTRDFSLASLRRQMSLITQDTVIFADTIAHNIAYGDERMLRRMVLRRRHPQRFDETGEEDRKRIIEAAQAAFADEFIREKPQGYDTDVGEHGTTLSGGQKQRLAIARAILRNAPIFIFDEATSQVDSESEQRIHDAVERHLQGRTALIIAHRFSTILQADRIVVMDRGAIVDSGRHEELIERSRLYQSLYGSQILDDKPATKKLEVAAST